MYSFRQTIIKPRNVCDEFVDNIVNYLKDKGDYININVSDSYPVSFQGDIWLVVTITADYNGRT